MLINSYIVLSEQGTRGNSSKKVDENRAYEDAKKLFEVRNLNLVKLYCCSKVVIYSHQVHPHAKPDEPKCTKIWENRCGEEGGAKSTSTGLRP